MKFSDYSLDPTLQAGIDKLGYTECTPIQSQAIGPVLSGQDVAGLAQTGTGKTAAFLIPMIERVLRSQNPAVEGVDPQRIFKDWKSNHFILVLVPTRELAEQVSENLTKLASEANIKGFAIYGGTGYEKQKEALRSGLQFVIATPGRLIDLYKEHLVDLKQVRGIIFDEADRMFDMGFKDDMKYVLQRVPQDRQFLVFSATLNFDVLNTAYQFGANPIELNVSRDQAKADNVKDEIFHVGHDEKPEHLISLLKLKQPKQAIIFSNFKHNVDRIAKFLTDNGIHASAISSLLTQSQRTKVMQQFKEENEHNILVATDVAARGLDIQGVDMVINYELPNDSESYVHRIGRTGRAGATGLAYSLVCDRDIDSLNRIEEYLKHKLAVGFLEDKDLVKDFKPFPQGDVHIQGALNPGRDSRDSRRGGGDSRRSGPPRSQGQGGSGPRREGGPRRDGARRDGYHPRKEGAARQRPTPTPGVPTKANGMVGNVPPGGAHKSAHSGKKPHPQHKNNKNFQHRPKPTSGARPAKPASSLGQKIGGFFKRLFGS